MALPVVKVSSGYFPVLECISYNMQEGLRVSRQGLQSVFSSVGLHIIQLRKKEIVALAVVRVSSGYVPVLECISYSTQEGLPVSR